MTEVSPSPTPSPSRQPTGTSTRVPGVSVTPRPSASFSATPLPTMQVGSTPSPSPFPPAIVSIPLVCNGLNLTQLLTPAIGGRLIEAIKAVAVSGGAAEFRVFIRYIIFIINNIITQHEVLRTDPVNQGHSRRLMQFTAMKFHPGEGPTGILEGRDLQTGSEVKIVMEMEVPAPNVADDGSGNAVAAALTSLTQQVTSAFTAAVDNGVLSNTMAAALTDIATTAGVDPSSLTANVPVADIQTTVTNPRATTPDDNKLTGGQIAGIVVGCVAGVAIIAVVAIVVMRRPHRHPVHNGSVGAADAGATAGRAEEWGHTAEAGSAPKPAVQPQGTDLM